MFLSDDIVANNISEIDYNPNDTLCYFLENKEIIKKQFKIIA